MNPEQNQETFFDLTKKRKIDEFGREITINVLKENG